MHAPMPDQPESHAALLAAIESRTARCAVVGLGFIGTTLVEALAQAGFPVNGVDRSAEAVAQSQQHLRDRGLEDVAARLGTDPAVLDGAPVTLIAVRAMPRPDGSFDLEPLRSAARAVTRAAGQGLVVLSSTVPPGTTRRFAGWVGAARLVAHAPERLSVGDDWRTLQRIPHLVAGTTPAACQLAAALFAPLCERVEPVSAPEVSELSKLLENAFLSVGIGLVGDVTAAAHGLGVSAHEVCVAAATKPTGYFPFFPGPGVGGHCLPNDLVMLAAAAAEAGAEPSVLLGTRRSLARQAALTVNRLQKLVENSGRPLSDARVLLVGVGFKPGCADTTASPAGPVAEALRDRGARVAYLDEQVDDWPAPRVRAAALSLERFEAAIVVAGDDVVSDEDLLAITPVVLRTSDRRCSGPTAKGVHRL